MQQNFRQISGGIVAWDNTSKYQICNVYGNFGAFVYQYVPQVTDGGDLYYANGTSTPTVGLSPASDSAWTALTGGAASMLPLPNGQIYIGNAGNQATANAVSGDITISNTGIVTLVNSSVIDQILTGYTAASGTVSDTDTIISAIQKIDGNLIGSSLFGTTTISGVQYNYELNNIAKTITFDIFDGTNFATITSDNATLTTFTYTLPTISGVSYNNIIRSLPGLITDAAILPAGGGNLSAWSTSINNNTHAVTIAASNTTGVNITDGQLFLSVKVNLN